MYVPDVFRLDDRATLLAHAAANPLATVITWRGDGITVSHLPLLVNPAGTAFRGHLARENPQLADFAAGAPVVAIFHGPHGYVSPSVYGEQPSVPTWNYVVVHVHGKARVVDDRELRTILEESVAHFDRTGWRPDGNGPFLASKAAAIAGFEIAIERLEGKWKVSQNRTVEDQARVISWLEGGDESSRALAAIMRDRRHG